MFCDLDGFKQINDKFDHAVGDDLLKVTARRLASTVPPADTVARLGGDEFATLLPADTEELETVGRRLAAAVRAPIGLGDNACTVTASTGLVAVNPASTLSASP
ncbi:GGDEF domain-containing protein [Parafrankia sp. EAN1pec]|uniref:GGDEF domain-containing protein n=1 Tax=Parafrankia sp. (strain EAN1pec) TaxID=298653 RepID=UPI00321B5D7E